MSKLFKLIQHNKKTLKDIIKKKESMLKTYNISTEYIIPNENIIDWNSEYTIKKNNIKCVKRETNELFYNDGILKQIYDINGNHDWILGYLFFSKYYTLFNNTINCLHIGFGKGDFILGINYFYKHINNVYKNTTINWHGFEKQNNRFSIHNKNNVINGIGCNNIFLNNNISHIKTVVGIHYNKLDFISCLIKPDHKKNNILLLIAVLLPTLNINGVMLLKIIPPKYWESDFLQYIILFCILFKTVEIVKYPIYKNKNIKYRYYLMCYKKKTIAYENNISKLLSYISSDGCDFMLSHTILNSKEILEWKLNFFKYNYNDGDPYDELIKIINSIKVQS